MYFSTCSVPSPPMSMAVFALPHTEASDMLPRYISMRPSAAGFTTAPNSPDLSPNRVYIEFVLTPLSADILRRFASWNRALKQRLGHARRFLSYYVSPLLNNIVIIT